MKSPVGALLPADWLLLAYIFALPLMKPAISYPVIAADLLFVVLILAVAVETAVGKRQLKWNRAYPFLLAYVASLAPSLIVSRDLAASLFKFTTEFYLIGVTVVSAWLIDSEAKLKAAIRAWLAGTAVMCAVGLVALAAFATGTVPALLEYSSFHFGTLPPGNYPRLAMTFFNANMACNYLTVSLGLVLVARARRWLGKGAFLISLTAILIAAVSTISPSLGGIALLVGTWLWLERRADAPMLAKFALAGGISAAAAFVVALAITPILHPTAPFLLHLPGGLVLAPAGRFLTWSAAAAEFARHPLLGHGIGIDAVSVRYLDPSGFLQDLTDAHNTFLSIAAQAGMVGLCGLGALIWLPVRLMRSLPGSIGDHTCFLLGATFLNAFVYQGLGASFEDTRHLWVLLGMLIATCRLTERSISRADENNRKAAAPSPD